MCVTNILRQINLKFHSLMLMYWDLIPYGLKYSEDLTVVLTNSCVGVNYIFSMAQQSLVGQSLLSTEDSLSHSTLSRTPSGWVISSKHIPLLDKTTTLTRDRNVNMYMNQQDAQNSCDKTLFSIRCSTCFGLYYSIIRSNFYKLYIEFTKCDV